MTYQSKHYLKVQRKIQTNEQLKYGSQNVFRLMWMSVIFDSSHFPQFWSLFAKGQFDEFYFIVHLKKYHFILSKIHLLEEYFTMYHKFILFLIHQFLFFCFFIDFSYFSTRYRFLYLYLTIFDNLFEISQIHFKLKHFFLIDLSYKCRAIQLLLRYYTFKRLGYYKDC